MYHVGMSDIARDVGRNVKVALVRLDMTQGRLAAKIDMTEQALSRRMRGTIAFNVVELERISQALDVPLVSLIGA